MLAHFSALSTSFALTLYDIDQHFPRPKPIQEVTTHLSSDFDGCSSRNPYLFIRSFQLSFVRCAQVTPCYLSVMAYHFSISAATSGTFSGLCSYCCLRSESLLFCKESSDVDFRTGVVFMDEAVVVVCVKSVSLERVVSCDESWRGIEFSCSACCIAFDMSIQTVGGVAFASVCIMVLCCYYKKICKGKRANDLEIKKTKKGLFLIWHSIVFACHE